MEYDKYTDCMYFKTAINKNELKKSMKFSYHFRIVVLL